MASTYRQFEILAGVAAGAVTPLNGDSQQVVEIAEPFGFGLKGVAVSGTTPTMDVDIETSFDGGTTWVVLDSFVQVTVFSGGQIITPALPPGALVRAVVTFGGTLPIYDFNIFTLGRIRVGTS